MCICGKIFPSGYAGVLVEVETKCLCLELHFKLFLVKVFFFHEIFF